MGSCQSSPEEKAALKASKEVERMMKEAKDEDLKKVKLLLLGAGESGKSTIFKQMRVLYGKPLTDEERSQITPVVYFNTISSMKTLIQQTTSFEYESDVSLNFAYQLKGKRLVELSN